MISLPYARKSLLFKVAQFSWILWVPTLNPHASIKRVSSSNYKTQTYKHLVLIHKEIYDITS